MDDADRAQERIESANECIECGALIPSDRQIAVPGCQFCADCATELERLRAIRR